jgi:DNA transposition AAA+ family ATPase
MAHPAPIRTRDYSEVRAELEQYLIRTGLTCVDFARRINYSKQAVYNFGQGRYPGNNAHICAAIRDFIAQHPIAAATATTGKLYETANVRTLRTAFYGCLDNQHAGVVYGGPGSQKTFALKHLIAELNRIDLAKNGHGRRAYYVYSRQGIRPSDLLKRVAEACGSSPIGNTDRIIRNIRFDFGKRNILLVFDEAQHLTVDCLETVRELLDELNCGLLFAGSHDLIRTFQRSIELEQWNSRVRTAVELPGITDEEADKIVHEELPAVNAKQLATLLKESRVPDVRKGNEYISARRLFFTVGAIREQMERRKLQ